VIKFPKFPSDEYTAAQAKGKLLADLGEVVVKEYGEKDAKDLLKKFNETQAAAESTTEPPKE
jgi:hypothetical protein